MLLAHGINLLSKLHRWQMTWLGLEEPGLCPCTLCLGSLRPRQSQISIGEGERQWERSQSTGVEFRHLQREGHQFIYECGQHARCVCAPVCSVFGAHYVWYSQARGHLPIVPTNRIPAKIQQRQCSVSVHFLPLSGLSHMKKPRYPRKWTIRRGGKGKMLVGPII